MEGVCEFKAIATLLADLNDHYLPVTNVSKSLVLLI